MPAPVSLRAIHVSWANPPTPALNEARSAPADAVFFDGQTAAGQPVLARLGDTSLVIHSMDGISLASWPRADLIRTDADAADEAFGAHATLRAGRGPQRLQIHDPDLLAELRQVGLIRTSSSAWSTRRWGALGAGFLVALAIAAVLIDQLPSLALPLVPHSLERGWSAGLQAALSSGSRRCRSPQGTAALSLLIGRLSAAAGITPAPGFAVIANPMINAFTLPDGRIVILQGLIKEVQDPDELSGVLAHELGHVRKRDPTREMLRALELNMLARSIGWGGNVAGQMAALSYGRKAEAAADASALQTLRAAHLRADGLSRFFTLLLQSTSDDALPAFLSNHPTTANRAADLQASGEGETAMDAPDWAAVRRICDQP